MLWAFQVRVTEQAVMFVAVVPLGFGLIFRFDPLSVPVTAGAEETTRIRYLVPDLVPKGMVAEMFPEVVDVILPMVTGLAKEPL